VNRQAGAFSRIFLLAAVLCLIPAAALAQSPWTLNRSGFFFQNTLIYSQSDQFYDETGNEVTFGDSAEFRDFTNSLYLEYGIRDWMGLVLSLPIKALQKDFGGSEPTLNTTGFGDFTLGLRFRTLQYPLVVSLQGEAAIPTGYNTSLVDPPLGDGVFNFAGRILAGRSLYPLRGYVQAGLGYRLRGKNASIDTAFSNQLLYNAEAGYWFFNKLLLIGRWAGTKASGGDEKFKQDFFGANLSLQYRVSQFVNLSAGFFQPVGGTNNDSGTRFLLGISFRGNQLGKYEGALSSTVEPTERDAEAVQKPSNTPPSPPAPESETETAPQSGESGEVDEPQSGDSP
jgi:hypothetical protein